MGGVGGVRLYCVCAGFPADYLSSSFSSTFQFEGFLDKRIFECSVQKTQSRLSGMLQYPDWVTVKGPGHKTTITKGLRNCSFLKEDVFGPAKPSNQPKEEELFWGLSKSYSSNFINDLISSLVYTVSFGMCLTIMNCFFRLAVIFGEECQKAEMFTPQAMPEMAGKNKVLIISFVIITSLPEANITNRLAIRHYNCKGCIRLSCSKHYALSIIRHVEKK